MKYYTFLIVCYIFLTKLIVNTDADVHGVYRASSAGYVVALITVALIILIVITRPNVLVTIHRGFYIRYALAYYFCALLFAVVSLIPSVSLFRSLSGLGFVFIGVVIGESLTQRQNWSHFNAEQFLRFLWCIFIMSAIAATMYDYLYRPTFTVSYVRAGYAGLLCAYLSMWYLIDFFSSREQKKLIFAACLFIFTAVLHSFSAYLAFYIGLVFLMFYKRSYFMVCVLLILPVILWAAVITYLYQHLGTQILGKDAGAYLTGSGRFDVYDAAWQAFISFDWFHKFFGVGFMAERNILANYNISWSSDVHNSFLSSLLGLGILGASIYVLFIVSPFLKVRRLRRGIEQNIWLKWIMMHVMFVAYGVTSSSYLASPSMQLIIFITFSHMIFRSMDRKAL